MLTYVNVGMLLLRIVVGLVLAGHGAQKLFGWFGGPGMAGATGMMQKLNMHPPRLWAWISALGEFLGGLGFAFGLLTPLAAVGIIGSMIVAIVKVHWAKGFWNTKGGLEFPLTLATVAFVVGLTGPGIYSLDYALKVALPEPMTYVIALIAMLIVDAAALIAIPALWREQKTA